MTTPLDWITAAAAVTGASGGGVALAGALRARWQLRAETIRSGQDRRENELHRQRLAEVWHQWHDLPAGPEREKAALWYSAWTGAHPGTLAPGTGSRDAGNAYRMYVDELAARQGAEQEPARPGRLSRLRTRRRGRTAIRAGAR
jgi:hypothetical protein